MLKSALKHGLFLRIGSAADNFSTIFLACRSKWVFYAAGDFPPHQPTHTTVMEQQRLTLDDLARQHAGFRVNGSYDHATQQVVGIEDVVLATSVKDEDAGPSSATFWDGEAK